MNLELTTEEADMVQSALGCYSHANLEAIYRLRTLYTDECHAQDKLAIKVGKRLRKLRHEIKIL